MGQFPKMQLQQEKQIAKSDLLRKCGLLAHTSAAFLKNCYTEKLFSCLRLISCNLYFHKSPPPIMPTFFVKYLTNIPESSIIRESVFFAGFGKSTAALTTFDSRGKDAGFL